jgi:quercetin dioxygenase-like cupin family protein
LKESDFDKASVEDFKENIVRPYDEVPITKIAEGCTSHFVVGQKVLISFITMEAGSVFPLHSHPEEQIMFVKEGYLDQVIGNKIYRIREGDVVYLPPNISHGGFLRDVDCKVIVIFSPARSDHIGKFREQHPEVKLRFSQEGT